MRVGREVVDWGAGSIVRSKLKVDSSSLGKVNIAKESSKLPVLLPAVRYGVLVLVPT